MGRTCSMYGAIQKCIQSFSGKRPLRRQRYRWDDNFKMDLKEVGCGHRDWIALAQDRVNGKLMYGRYLTSGSLKAN